ncbi:hypothetical protein Ae201684_004130 [Aphanomyces euteiches]|uniref:Uncharacterized protein n=1 Tax=Aphanomyces euteiches TaxID=100861 RepID=A0A6G0XJA4_9STRA|nr:hypothetical protein Ae201684_004130 [Aphanomyces euteiches]
MCKIVVSKCLVNSSPSICHLDRGWFRHLCRRVACLSHRGHYAFVVATSITKVFVRRDQLAMRVRTHSGRREDSVDYQQSFNGRMK